MQNMSLQKIFDTYQSIKTLNDRITAAGMEEGAMGLEHVAQASVHHIPMLQDLINLTQAQNYLEIGVAEGHCFCFLSAPQKVGVDPAKAPELVESQIKDGLSYYQLTSDKFFRDHGDMYQSNKIDIAFIDGLHTYEQVMLDFENCYKYLNDNGIIVMHDCNPSDAIMASSLSDYELYVNEKKTKGESFQGTWCGDVWKSVLHLRATHDDISIFTLNCDFGIAVIKKGKPESMLDLSVDQIANMSYAELELNREEYLNLKSPLHIFNFMNQFSSRKAEVL